jgi:cob(I)alamin adenosyltransferase
MSRKYELRIETVGQLDELNSHLGLCLHGAAPATDRPGQVEILAALAPVQSELFVLGALLANPMLEPQELAPDSGAIARMEQQIDQIGQKLPVLRNFIFPGGSELACRLHIARTVCRRGERVMVAAKDGGVNLPQFMLPYMNRLSDLLFALARLANYQAGEVETYWHGPKHG